MTSPNQPPQPPLSPLVSIEVPDFMVGGWRCFGKATDEEALKGLEESANRVYGSSRRVAAP